MAHAEGASPRQLLFPPLPLAPFDFDRPPAASVRFRVYHLVDTRRVESYRFSNWFRIGDHHALRWDIGYGGVESGSGTQYGGGPTSLQWSWHQAAPGSGGIALDLLGVAPTGDSELHPLSARAPSMHGRLRWSPFGGRRVRAWVGWWARRVSPPEERTEPLSSFPSGSGLDAQLRAQLGRASIELWGRQDLGGLPDQTWVEARLGWTIDPRLAVEVGASTAVGPERDRLMDVAWTLAVFWRLPPPPGARR